MSLQPFESLHSHEPSAPRPRAPFPPLPPAAPAPPIRAAMVLAAGLGTRMRPLTDERPKPLVEVAGRPLIDHLLDRLAAGGIERAVVNLHHRADQMEAHLARRAARGAGPAIALSDERDGLLDSGGGVLKALPLLGEGPFLVCNADAIWTEGPAPAVARLIGAYDPARMDALLLLAPTATATGWANRGDFAMDADGRLRRPHPREITPFAYAGVGAFDPALFEGRPERFSLNLLFDEAIAAGRLFGQRLGGTWMHVGTPEAVGEAERALERSAR